MSNPSSTLLFDDAIEFDWDALQTVPADCYLLVLSQQHIGLILSSLRFASAQYHWRYTENATWANDVEPFIQNLKGLLMAGCKLDDLVTQITRIADALDPALASGKTSNDALAEMAEALGVDLAWGAIEAGLALLFPEAAIPIAVGVPIIKGLVDNANSSESETFEIARMLGSPLSGVLPDD